jgi:hypothetical protein
MRSRRLAAQPYLRPAVDEHRTEIVAKMTEYRRASTPVFRRSSESFNITPPYHSTPSFG